MTVIFGGDGGEVAQQSGVDIHAIRLWPRVLDTGLASAQAWSVGGALGMRRVVLPVGVTVDGYVARPGDEGDWRLPDETPVFRLHLTGS
jgi:hypothetical protein